jgi:predicted RNA polymerase sigma factor
MLRRDQARPGKERASLDLSAGVDPAEDELPEEDVVRDDRLRLIFTCCHPALARDAQVTLALRTLCGLSPAEIASVLLTSESAVAKRLTRTRSKIAKARIPYDVPADEDLPSRLAAVCAVVHASYTVAHSAIGGDRLVDVDGCREALRLGRLVHELMPDEPMPMAVLSLVLFTEARRSARFDDSGEPLLLPDQDRSRWDRAMVVEARTLLDDSLRRTGAVADPYQLQAAIAREHMTAASYAKTDWEEVVRLYDLLLSVQPSPAVALARAVAVAEASGTAVGLATLESLERSHRWWAVRGEMLAREGRYDEAVAALRASLTGDLNTTERQHRERRIAAWSELASG